MPAIDAHGQGVYPCDTGPSTSKFSVDRSEATVHLLRYRDSSAEHPVIIEVLKAHPAISAVAPAGNGYPAGVAVAWAMHYPTVPRRIDGDLMLLASLPGTPQAAS